MIGDSLLPLKAACYAALSANSGFMALITGLFDQQAPTNQPFNYVVMGHGTEIPMNVMGKSGRECTLTFDIFTQGTDGAGGSLAGLTIANALVPILAQTTLTLNTTPAQTCGYVDFDNYSDQMEGDALPVYHGLLRLLFRVQEV